MGIFEKARREAIDTIKQEIIMESKRAGDELGTLSDGSVNLDSHRELEAMVRRHLGAAHVVMCADMPDGTVLTYIPEEIGDKELVYIIQTLTDLRTMRLNE